MQAYVSKVGQILYLVNLQGYPPYRNYMHMMDSYAQSSTEESLQTTINTRARQVDILHYLLYQYMILSLGLIYDICSMFFRLQNSQHQTTILRTTAKQTDFCISAQKTRINLKQTVGIKICNTKKEDAGFTFLGRIVGISEFTKKIINKGEKRLNKLLPFETSVKKQADGNN